MAILRSFSHILLLFSLNPVFLGGEGYWSRVHQIMEDITNQEVIVFDEHHPQLWLSDEQRPQVAEILLSQATETQLPYGTITELMHNLMYAAKSQV